MPNVTVYVTDEHTPSDSVLDDLTNAITDLCTGLLRALLENVHVVFVRVRPGRGHPVFVEVLYRLETYRPETVMVDFMNRLDDAIVRTCELTARIRCFGYPAGALYARN
ncbi:hypothetical protein OAX51_01525 (plasmid) [Rhodococcus erythropolis]